MPLVTQTALEALSRVPENGKAEIINGELVLMPPTGFLPGYAAGEIDVSLRDYGRRTRSGYAIPDNTGFLVNLPNRQSFSPDAAFYTGTPTGMKFINGAPVFAVEVGMSICSVMISSKCTARLIRQILRSTDAVRLPRLNRQCQAGACWLMSCSHK